ncbi:MAG TPA: hypothetical protein VF135_10680 [Terriglobales bacterium]
MTIFELNVHHHSHNGRDAHGMTDIDDKTREKIRGAIHNKAA